MPQKSFQDGVMIHKWTSGVDPKEIFAIPYDISSMLSSDALPPLKGVLSGLVG